MGQKAPHENLAVRETLSGASHAASTVNGAAVDTIGFEDCLVVLIAGTAGASATVDVVIQESSASGSGFAAITGAAFTQVTTANDLTVYVGRISLLGRKRYLRAVATVATAASIASVQFVLTSPHKVPVSQTNALAFNLDPS